MEFQEKYKIDLCRIDSTGSTTPNFTRWYDMRNYRRVDFLIAGQSVPAVSSTGAQQQFTAQIYLATNATGGGATALSSATVIAGKLSTSGIATVSKADELMIRFATIHGKDTSTSFTIGTAVYYTGAASAAMYFEARASANATVASEGFITLFNSTVNNTATALTANFEAIRMHSSSTKAADPVVRIVKKTQDSTARLTFTEGCTHVSIGMPVLMHLGADVQHMTDGKRYVALAVNSSDDSNPYSVTLFREYEYPPVDNRNINISKSLSGSTGK